ncbi:MAG: phosphoribosylformylglycinamidine synthase subunit PurL [Bacteroidia bacterium]|nr:phosphoribosylformylglycinamidine synthase subunit PurL [Bacteroidia bacterium]
MSKTEIQEVGLETAKKLGLLPEEFDKICGILGRKPNFTELSVYSVMWSEHCSYKNSILWLKKLPKEGPHVLAGAGEENAGLMDIGDGLAVCFKIESHNHPSAIEPYQGAATGVGGIQRDIFTMGARPIASLNSLRFGDPSLPKTRHLLKGVVKGIGDYGNAFGVPTVAGEVYFDECYNTNPLVNAMSVGIVKHNQTASAVAKGNGNPVYIVGSSTGRDGIHGATFASEDIHEDSHKDLPSVQVGDPFTEKLLLEATLEAIQTGAVVGIQDMGAAGITCSTSEMSEKGGSGMEVWLDKVPTREPGMKPFEILLSESQERMLIVAEKGREQEILDIFAKWDLNCAQIGVVNGTGIIEYFVEGESVGKVPAETLVLGGGAPVYTREMQEPTYLGKIARFDSDTTPQPNNHPAVARFLLELPSIANKHWITTQYDSMVGRANLSTNYPSDAAVVHVLGTSKGIAVTTDCNSRYVNADPRKGCAMAVCEAIRNITCSGGIPLGVTNCLNFGNPYNPEVYWQFANAILGMKDACEKFGTPVTGGNVSFYNQSSYDGPVYPTPTIGMVGLVDDVEKSRMTLDFKAAGDQIYLLGVQPNDIACSEYLYRYHNVKYSPAPYFNLDEEYNLYHCMRNLLKNGAIQSAHDLSEGGLIVAMMESGFHRNLGFTLKTNPALRKDAFLYGEAGGRILITVKKGQEKALKLAMAGQNVPLLYLGDVTSGNVQVDGENWGEISEFKQLHTDGLEKALGLK